MVVIIGGETGTVELTYNGYIDPHVVHKLKRGAVTGVITERRWIEIDGIGRTGLRIPDRDGTSEFTAGTPLTITLEDGLFLGTVETQDD